MKLKLFLLAGAAALAGVAMACGDDHDPKSGDAASGDEISQPGGAAGGGLTLPNTWIDYEGERLQLTNILFEGVDASPSEFIAVGRFDSIDIEGTTGELFTRAGDSEAVWTYTPPSGGQDKEPNGMWHRWAPPPAGDAAASS